MIRRSASTRASAQSCSIVVVASRIGKSGELGNLPFAGLIDGGDPGVDGGAGSVAKFVRIGEFSALDGVRSWRMNDFKGRHFGGEIVLWAVRW